jgi:hypothetical protein
MTTKKRTPKGRGRRSNEDSVGAVPAERRNIVCSERRALMRADAVLRCVAVALEYDDWNCDGSDYAEAIEAARNLIATSIERLESRSTPDTLRSKAQQ